jgi:predicted aspartyl protease
MIIKVKLTVSNSQVLTKRTDEIEAVVDSGSLYAWIPRAQAEKVEIAKVGRQRFRTITGQIAERDYGAAIVTVDGALGVSEIVFAEPGDGTVLGALAMEGLGIKIDPQSGRISKEDVFLAY